MINLGKYLADEQIRLLSAACENDVKEVSIGFGERIKGFIAGVISSLASCFSSENKWSHIAAEAYAQFWEGRRFVVINARDSDPSADGDFAHTSHRVAGVASPRFPAPSSSDNCVQIKNGIRNPGNACYAISIIEAVRFNPSLRELVTRPLPHFRSLGTGFDPVDEQAWNVRNELKKALADILESLDRGETVGSEEIKRFFEKVKSLGNAEYPVNFDWQNQRDAQDFFVFLIRALYVGTDINENGEAVRSEKMLIREKMSQDWGLSRDSTDICRISLPSKEVNGQRKVSCDSFKDALVAELKKMNQTLGNAPPILMFSLSRAFFPDGTQNNKIKIKGGIEISQKLDIGEFLTEGKEVDSAQYELSTIVEHRGSAADSGHYVTYQCLESGQWICCNDSSVSNMPRDFNPKSIEASLVFYRKVQI